MQAVDGWNAACGAAKKVGRGVGGALGKVNPDVWRELVCAAANVYTLALPKREPVIDRGADGHLPIVLVHGLGANRGTWTPLRLYLRLHGRRRVYAYGYEDGTVEDLAAGLVDFIRKVKEATGESRVDLVSHSLGGILARYAVQRLGLVDSVRTLVTLASPHRGTYMANWANTKLTKALRADSDVIADLNGDDLSALPVRLVTVWSDRDIYVVPHEHMTLAGAENVFLPGISHTQHILSPQVYRIVLDRLAPIEATEASPA